MSFSEAIGTFLFSIFRLSTPIIYAALAACITKQTGLLNMAIEGIMLTAALSSVVFSALTQSVVLGVLFGMLAGSLIGGIISYANLIGKTELYLTCIAINLIATGGTTFALYMITGTKGTTFSALPSLEVPNIDIPFIKDIPILGTMLSGHSILTYFAFICAFLVWLLIYKTRLGLRMRCVGENPNAALSVGISVTRIKTVAYLISGAVGGLGGAFMSMSYVTWFSRDMLAGRGFIGLSANNITAGSPVGATLFSMLFGIADASANVLQITAAGLSYFVKMIPYIITILGMVIMEAIRIRKGLKFKDQVVRKAISGTANEKDLT